MRFIPLDRLPELESCLRRIVRNGTRTQARDALAVILGLHGLRITEVRNLQLADVDLASRTIAVGTLKRRKKGRGTLGGPGAFRPTRRVAAHRSVLEELIEWNRGRPGPLLYTRTGGAVAVTHWRRFVVELYERALGGRWRFHDLRHTFGTRLYSETRDVFLVKEQLGHASVSSTDVYVHNVARVPESVLPDLLADDDAKGLTTNHVAFTQKRHVLSAQNLAPPVQLHLRLYTGEGAA